MDVSAELAAHAAKFDAANAAQQEETIIVDAGVLAAFDEAPTDDPEYETDLETYLLNRSTLSAQTLIRTLFTLPLTRGPLGPTATLPPSTSHSATSENSLLPREKPLPKPKPPTKWERFAKEKGISKTRKDKKVWDEELQDWVDRWGRHGKNKGEEEAWIRVIKNGEDADHDPIATSRAERKARIAKNKSQQLRNLSEAAAKSASPSTSTLPPKASSAGGSSVSAAQKAKLRDARKKELERSLLLSKGATASMGKFDKKLEGEPKIKGVKRKFAPTAEKDFSTEKSNSLAILSNVGKSKPGKGGEGDVNVRKALRFHDREERKNGGGGGGGKDNKRRKR